MKKGVEIVPEDNYRLRNEDLYTQEAKAAKDFGTKSTGP
jgi:hypothetical protein